jgi:hypothetical protein
MREIKETFRGLSRGAAYARLGAMGLTPIHWIDTDAGTSESTGPVPERAWPPDGDVEIELTHLKRPEPPGTCGSGNARVVLHFDDDRVSRIREETTIHACL